MTTSSSSTRGRSWRTPSRDCTVHLTLRMRGGGKRTFSEMEEEDLFPAVGEAFSIDDELMAIFGDIAEDTGGAAGSNDPMPVVEALSFPYFCDRRTALSPVGPGLKTTLFYYFFYVIIFNIFKIYFKTVKFPYKKPLRAK